MLALETMMVLQLAKRRHDSVFACRNWKPETYCLNRLDTTLDQYLERGVMGSALATATGRLHFAEPGLVHPPAWTEMHVHDDICRKVSSSHRQLELGS